MRSIVMEFGMLKRSFLILEPSLFLFSAISVEDFRHFAIPKRRERFERCKIIGQNPW